MHSGGNTIVSISVKFTPKELVLLSSLAADQLFQREFIDARFPGYKPNHADLSLGKQLIERLRLLTAKANGLPVPRKIVSPS